MTKRAVFLLALSGCVPTQPVGESEGALFSNDQSAFQYFVGKGLTTFQAAGIVGNLDQESGVNPASVQFGGGPGRGIAQWSTGGRWDTSSNDNVLGYAQKVGASSGSLDLQLEFIWYELTTFGYGFSQLKATTNVTDATVVFMDKYEICGTCDETNRVSDAKAVLSAYGAIAISDWSATFVSQSWPYASAPAFTVKCGKSVDAKIVLKNSGAKSWSASTKLGTTQPRDRASIFAGSDWLAPNRAASSGTVAPGGDGTFSFSFTGPVGKACVPGTYHEYFGVVEEGVAWFSDNGQGGPPDNQLEALIDLVAGDPEPVDMARAASPDLAEAPIVTGDDGGAAPSSSPEPAVDHPVGEDAGDDTHHAASGKAGCNVVSGAGASGDLLLILAVVGYCGAALNRRRSPAPSLLPFRRRRRA